MSSALQVGTTFAGRYQILRCIAVGGMGAVYEVIHTETARRRALKVMHPHILRSSALRERFKQEAKVAAYVESEFIVDVFDAGFDESTQMPFLVMELLRGEELGKRLARLGPLPPAEALRYLHQTALALDKTHRASIVHRDLKPENLFLTEREDGPPRVKVLDFGIAKLIADSATDGGVTQSIGTPIYMSPEQFKTESKVSPASDIYALGMMAYTLLVGIPYWDTEAKGGNIFSLVAAAMHGPQQSASVRAATVGIILSPAFDRWFATATAVDPIHRFATASAAVRALADVFEVRPFGHSEVAPHESGAFEPEPSQEQDRVTNPAVVSPITAPIPTSFTRGNTELTASTTSTPSTILPTLVIFPSTHSPIPNPKKTSISAPTTIELGPNDKGYVPGTTDSQRILLPAIATPRHRNSNALTGLVLAASFAAIGGGFIYSRILEKSPLAPENSAASTVPSASPLSSAVPLAPRSVTVSPVVSLPAVPVPTSTPSGLSTAKSATPPGAKVPPVPQLPGATKQPPQYTRD